MKLFSRLFFTGLLIFGVFYAHGQEWKRPIDLGGNYLFGFLSDVHFVNAETGWAVGENGLIVTTSDGGNNWISQNSGAGWTLQSVYFVDENTGWTVDQYNRILKTVDGGEIWYEQVRVIGGGFHSVFFVDENTGWAVGSEVVKTNDGGITWVEQSIPGPFWTINLRDAYFLDEDIGWAVGGFGKIIKTVDGGSNWIEQSSNTSTILRSTHFVNENTGWAVGNGGTMLKTTDGGDNWVEQNSGTTKSLHSIAFANENTGWAIGIDGLILKTTDGGANWVEQNAGTTSNLNAVQIMDSNALWVVGDHGTILGTEDAGAIWNSLIYSANHFFSSVHFVNANTGFAMGGFGSDKLFVTNDGGINWSVENLGFTNIISDIHFLDENTGWIVGVGGLIMHTNDGGHNWTTQVCGSSGNLTSIFFINDTLGWLVGFDAKIHHTEDAGATWVEQNSGTSNSLRSIYFIDDYTGWAVGDNGTILKTINGGNDWLQLTSGTNNDLNSVHFTDADTGLVVGDDVILKTTNGGSTWTPQSVPYSYYTYNSVYFTDADTGWAVGTSGSIISTTNGGVEWTFQWPPSGRDLNSVHFVESDAGWAVGELGRIYLYFPCSDANLTLTSTNDSENQSVCLNSPITNITYEGDGDFTGADVFGLPEGVSGSFSSGVFTLSGTPEETGKFNYVVTTTGTPSPCSEGTASGIIEVNESPLPTADNLGPYYEGDTIELTATGGIEYAWSGPDGFSSTEQNPYIENATSAKSGTYYVTVTNSSGCNEEASTEVIVNEIHTISGLFERGNGEPLSDVVVNYFGDESGAMSTDSDGFYEFSVQSGASIEVGAERNTSWVEFVSTLDLINIQRHLLNIELLDSPYKIIAADAVNNGVISTLDLIQLQRLLVGIIDSIPGNASWCFVPADYDFIDPDDPLNENFPEIKEYNDLDSNKLNEDWVAIKTGDVTWPSSGIRMAPGQPISLVTAELESDGHNHTTRLSAPKQPTVTTGYQFELHFDADEVTIDNISIDESDLPGITSEHFFIDNEKGMLRTLWYDGRGFEMEPGTVLFDIDWTSERKSDELVSAVSVSPSDSRLTAFMAFENQPPISLRLVKDEIEEVDEILLSHRVLPNPWSHAAELRVELAKESRMEIEIFDATGRLAHSFEVKGSAGVNSLHLDSKLPAGKLFYTIRVNGVEYRGQMIRVD